MAYVVLVAAAAQFLLVFVANPGWGTIASAAGGLGAVLGLVPMTGLCVATAITEVRNRPQSAFVATAVAAYFGPELYFYLGSLLLGPNFAYLGNAIYSTSGESAWFLLAQGAAALAAVVPTLLITRGNITTKTAR